jgi:hypothetical protein
VTKSAGGKGFGTYVYPSIIYYGLKGNIRTGAAGYLWPGTQAISGTFPDPGLPAAYFRVQQPALISGMSVASISPPGTSNSVTLSIYVLPLLTTGTTAAVYTGYISNTTLTVSSGPSQGTIAVGQSVTGQGIISNTYILSGSGSTWTIGPNVNQTVGSSGSPITITNGQPVCTFVGAISGTTLTVTSVSTGAIAIGQYIAGTSVNTGTYITAGSGTTWTVSVNHNVGSTTLYASGHVSTPFTVTLGASDTQKTFYNGSTRVNAGDKIILHVSYVDNNNTNAAHDITAQIDLF